MITELSEQYVLSIQKEIEIHAPAAIAFAAVLDQCGPGFTSPDGKSMAMKLEAWPGGRWFRDLGNNTGHFWGQVQVIKPPTLLELIGPMFMSYPVMSHVQYRLVETGGVTKLSLSHRAMGEIAPDHRKGLEMGWDHLLSQIKKNATR